MHDFSTAENRLRKPLKAFQKIMYIFRCNSCSWGTSCAKSIDFFLKSKILMLQRILGKIQERSERPSGR